MTRWERVGNTPVSDAPGTRQEPTHQERVSNALGTRWERVRNTPASDVEASASGRLDGMRGREHQG